MRLHPDYETEAVIKLAPDQLSKGNWQLVGLGNLPDVKPRTGMTLQEWKERRRTMHSHRDWSDEECLAFATALANEPNLRISDFASRLGTEIDCEDLGEMKLRVLERAQRKVEKTAHRIPSGCRKQYRDRCRNAFMDMCGPIRASV